MDHLHIVLDHSYLVRAVARFEGFGPRAPVLLPFQTQLGLDNARVLDAIVHGIRHVTIMGSLLYRVARADPLQGGGGAGGDCGDGVAVVDGLEHRAALCVCGEGCY